MHETTGRGVERMKRRPGRPCDRSNVGVPSHVHMRSTVTALSIDARRTARFKEWACPSGLADRPVGFLNRHKNDTQGTCAPQLAARVRAPSGREVQRAVMAGCSSQWGSGLPTTGRPGIFRVNIL